MTHLRCSLTRGSAVPRPEERMPVRTDGYEPRRIRTVAGQACALFAIGVSLYRPGTTQGGSSRCLFAGKLLLHPLVVWLAFLAFGLERLTITAGVLTAALPMARWVFIFAQRFESDVARICTALVASTALAAITFSALVWYLGLGIAAK